MGSLTYSIDAWHNVNMCKHNLNPKKGHFQGTIKLILSKFEPDVEISTPTNENSIQVEIVFRLEGKKPPSALGPCIILIPRKRDCQDTVSRVRTCDANFFGVSNFDYFGLARVLGSAVQCKPLRQMKAGSK